MIKSVTVGIPSRGRPFHLASLLLNLITDWELLSYTIKEIIVLDDNDTPIVKHPYISDVCAIAKGLDVPLSFTTPKGGIGQTAGHQKILDTAKTPWILRLNDDLWFSAEMLDCFFANFFSKKHSEKFAGAGWMFRFPHPQIDGYMPNIKRNVVDIELDCIDGPPIMAVINGLDFEKRKIVCQQHGVISCRNLLCGEFLYGAGFLYNADLARSVGGYEPHVFEDCRALHEEVHLCYRMHKKSGKYFYIDPKVWCFDMNPPSNVDKDGYSRRPYEQDSRQKKLIEKHERKMWELWEQ